VLPVFSVPSVAVSSAPTVSIAATLTLMATIPQAGAIVFRRDDGFVRVLLVRSKKDPSLWVFPKGGIEAGETPQVAALRETFEEAGVSGLIVARAGSPLRFESAGRSLVVDYFLVEMTAEMASPEGREKCWCLPEDAAELVTFQNTRDLLKGALARIPPSSRARE
jgi:8-oxo-dGTP pyrophosphatase MutT (NUDIX family)